MLAVARATDAIHRKGKLTVIRLSAYQMFTADNYNENVENGFDVATDMLPQSMGPIWNQMKCICLLAN